ncbi:Uncharacterised protein [Acinetobacter baumannii]|nr:Uncharacterised protein [Acinetobacter baumannii]
MIDGGLVLPLQVDEQYVHRAASQLACHVQRQLQGDRAVLATGEGDTDALEVPEYQSEAG